MRNNIEILKTEIDRLVEDGFQIIKDEVGSNKKEDRFATSKKSSNDVSVKYNVWYSESLPLIKLVLPERFDEFTSHYLPSKTRKKIIYETFRIADYLTKVEELALFDLISFDIQEAFINLFKVQLGIVKSCKNRLESKLDNIRAILQAELFDNELDSAKHLHKNMFYRASGMLAGVVLENHLKNVCLTHQIILPKNPTISNYNELLKNNDIIEITIWRHLSLLGDLRNICSHGKDKEPTRDEVSELIDGVTKMIKKIY
jgi:HEPN domain